MPTEFDYISQATTGLDANKVESYDDESREVEVFTEETYNRIKKSELTNYFWNFNQFVFKLTIEGTTPTDGTWANQYLEPPDVLRYINIMDSSGTTMRYEVAQGRIFTNETGAYAKYLRNLDENDFPVYFQDVLVARLKAEGAEPLVGEGKVVERAWNEYRAKRREARNIDRNDNQAAAIIVDQSPWLQTFRGNYNGYYWGI